MINWKMNKFEIKEMKFNNEHMSDHYGMLLEFKKVSGYITQKKIKNEKVHKIKQNF